METEKEPVPTLLDTGLACLVMLARFHQIAVDPEQLTHQFGVPGEPASAGPRAGFGKTEILLAAKHLGLQAKAVKTAPDRLDRIPLPALAADGNGGYFILARYDADKALIHDPRAERPQVITRDELLARWTGELILFASRASTIGELAKFDFSWFIPAVVKYRKLLGEVLLVFFVLNLFALVFTKYGTLSGRITQVSSDAIQDEKLGLIYSTRVKLDKDTLRVENKTVRLTPGMAVTVEVKTGTRRVIEYFLSPLMQVTSESLRER